MLSRRLLPLAVIATLVACASSGGGKQPSTAAETGAHTAPPATAAAPPAGADGTGEPAADGTPMTAADEAEMLALIVEVTDAVCACQDMPCLQDLSTRFAPRMQKFASMTPTPEFMQQMQAAGTKMEACVEKLMGNAGAGGGAAE